MINSNAQEQIKKEIGINYAEKILNYLNEHKVLNARGKSFSISAIRQLLNTDWTHTDLEYHVFECYSHYKKLNQQEEQRRKEILES